MTIEEIIDRNRAEWEEMTSKWSHPVEYALHDLKTSIESGWKKESLVEQQSYRGGWGFQIHYNIVPESSRFEQSGKCYVTQFKGRKCRAVFSIAKLCDKVIEEQTQKVLF